MSGQDLDIFGQNATLDKTHDELQELDDVEVLDALERTLADDNVSVDRTMLVNHARTRGYSFTIHEGDVIIRENTSNTVVRHLDNVVEYGPSQSE